MRVAIVGGGPAGLSCALTLAQRGYSITIFERMDDLSMQGSGIIIQPVGLAALELLGIRAEIEQLGQPIYRVTGRSGDRNRLSVLVDYSLASDTQYALGLQRGALFNVLHKKVLAAGAKIITATVIDFLSTSSAQTTSLTDTNGNIHGPFEFVIDASGAYSKLRHYAIAPVASQPLEYGSLWTMVDWVAESNFDYSSMEMYSDNRNVGVGLMPVGKLDCEASTKLALFWNLKWKNYPDWRATNLVKWKNSAIQKWPTIEPFFRQITTHDQLYLAKFIYHRLSKPYGDRLAFVGDAAHATNPQLGQGVNMSLVDAVVLSWALQQERDINNALKLYARSRRAHVIFYQTFARLLTPFYQSDNSLAIACRDALYEPLCKIPCVRRWTAELISGQIAAPLISIPRSR